jgi:hypothetical protein
MRVPILIPAASGLFGLVALIGLSATPAYALESTTRASDQFAYEQCLNRLGCPKTQSTCHLHCRTNPTLGDGPYGQGTTIIRQQGGAAAPGKAVPVQKLQLAPAQ